ncbi:MAG: hypothetical protein ACLQVI_31290 [Polyangiaceae bacterium]
MALHKCAECQQEVSDKALACPHCGMPQRAATAAGAAPGRTVQRVAIAVALLVCLGGGAAAAGFMHGRSDYSRVEQLRAEQDADGTHDEHVRQRFFRLYKAHPQNAMYIYLWARCVDDAAEQLKLAQEGIQADPHFSWNYNMASRALARQNRVPEAYDEANKGAAIDPGNMELSQKQTSLKAILDHKLAEEAPPAPTSEKNAARYQGLFRAPIKSPDRSDLQAIETSRPPDGKSPGPGAGTLAEAVRGFVVCANPFADACVRAYVPRDARFKGTWSQPSVDVTSIKEHQLVTLAGSVVTNGKGENILLADTVTVEAP